MKVIILGSGGREHTLAWKLSKEIGAENIYIAPGNGGTQNCGTNVTISLKDFEGLAAFCLDNNIDVVLPGSEDPIADGIRDYFESKPELKAIFVLSPDQNAGKLESSKSFAKEFMKRHEVPTAAYGTFTPNNIAEGYQLLESLSPPYVLKADGLAAGKGVLIINDLSEAKLALKEMLLESKFGSASSKVVIEEFLDGIEFSVFALTDGINYKLLPEAKDYKRIGEGDTGLNTGGMGAVSPVPFFDEELRQKTVKQIIEPTIKGFQKDGLNYRGFVFFGLINVGGEPKVIEYNVRMGDPETEVVIPRIKDSLSSQIEQIRSENFTSGTMSTITQTCATVFAVSAGYPEAYEKEKSIEITEANETIFHAGTKVVEGAILTNGGRVLACTALGDSIEEALKSSYALMDVINFEGKTFRTDIGQDLLSIKKNGTI